MSTYAPLGRMGGPVRDQVDWRYAASLVIAGSEGHADCASLPTPAAPPGSPPPRSPGGDAPAARRR